ncbi:MAG: SPOR domain-containing protein [candidate division Zixibacteria bacterium]|nr:SPOR domain-containing protein [candidate division Zixibacteria bacterium]
MINIQNIFKLILIVPIFIIGCGAGVHKTSVDKDKRTESEHRFDPLGFPGDDAVITGKSRTASKPVISEQSQPVSSQYPVSVEVDDLDVDEQETQPPVIFRVQIFASKSFDEAQQFAADIEGLFPEGVFVEYQMPYYKVRVGEFYEPEGGEDFLEYVKETGFKDAWLVRVIH